MRAAARWWAFLAVSVAAGLPCTASGETRVYGLELQRTPTSERVLVFADGPVTARLTPRGDRAHVVILPGAKLDPTAPRHLDIAPGSNVTRVTASEVSVAEKPGVEVMIEHASGFAPKLEQEGSQVAISFPRRAAGAEEGIRLDGRDVDIGEVAKRIAIFTGIRLIYDELLRGPITIYAPEPFTKSEAAAFLDTLLLTRGFVALPSPGGARTIAKIQGAPAPFVADLAEASGDQPVTTVIRLHAIKAETVMAALQPLLGDATLGQVHDVTNSLILAGSAARVKRIEKIVRALDDSGTEHIFLRPLRFADVERAADLLEGAFAGRGLVSVWPDVRTHTLAVRAKVDAIPAVRDFLATLDRPATSRGEFHVFPIQNASADRIAQILLSLQGGGPVAGPVRAPAAAGRGGLFGSTAEAAGASSLAGRTFALTVDRPTHSLVVQADPDTAKLIHEIIGELDQPPRQVEVEVNVMEVAISDGLDLAFDYFLPLTNPNKPDDLIAFAAGVPSGSASSLFSGSGVDTAITGNPLVSIPPVTDSLHARFARSPIFIPVTMPDGSTVPVAIPRETASLTADQRQVYAKVLMRPRLLVASGDEQELFAGDNVPILTAQTNTTDPLLVQQSVERQDVGLDLRVKPTLGADGAIVLDLMLDVKSLAPSVTGNEANTGPTLRERKLTSTIRLEHDRVAVIGYYDGPASMQIVTGVPWLEDIPVLGWLFRASSGTTLRNHLLISVTARRDDTEVRALGEALRRALAAEVASAAPAP